MVPDGTGMGRPVADMPRRAWIGREQGLLDGEEGFDPWTYYVSRKGRVAGCRQLTGAGDVLRGIGEDEAGDLIGRARRHSVRGGVGVLAGAAGEGWREFGAVAVGLN